MRRCSNSLLFGFILALMVNVAAQVVRLQQTTALGWLLCDYSGRLSAILILAAIPDARAVIFQRELLRTSWAETALWLFSLVIFFLVLDLTIIPFIDARIPNTQLGHYIEPYGALRLFDLTAGLALVAYHEEIVFRRCARAVINPVFSDGAVLIFLTSLLFAAHHWTTGLGNIVACFFFGIYAMLFYRRVGAIWPVVLAHYFTDLVCFL